MFYKYPCGLNKLSGFAPEVYGTYMMSQSFKLMSFTEKQYEYNILLYFEPLFNSLTIRLQGRNINLADTVTDLLKRQAFFLKIQSTVIATSAHI